MLSLSRVVIKQMLVENGTLWRRKFRHEKLERRFEIVYVKWFDKIFRFFWFSYHN